MSVSNYSIIPATEEDVPTIGQLLQASKLQLTINRLLYIDWPDESRQRELYTRSVQAALEDPLHEVFKVVQDGEIVAHLTIARREGVQGQAPVEVVYEDQDVPPGVQPDIFLAVMRGQTVIHKDIKDTAHLELVYVYVKRSSRCQGIGSQMVRLALDRAEAAGLPLFLHSEPAAHDFFLSQGLKDTKWVDIDLSQWAEPHSGFGEFRLTGMTTSA